MTEEMFIIEAIRKSRKMKIARNSKYGLTIDLEIKWLNYPESENTWEPYPHNKSMLDNRVVDSFLFPILRKLGYDPDNPSSLQRLSKTPKLKSGKASKGKKRTADPQPSSAGPGRDGKRKRRALAPGEDPVGYVPTSGRRLDMRSAEPEDWERHRTADLLRGARAFKRFGKDWFGGTVVDAFESDKDAVAVLTLFTDDDYVLIPYNTLVANSAYTTAESAGEVKRMLTHYEQDVQASFGSCPVCCHPYPKGALNQHVDACLGKKETIRLRAESLAREALGPVPPMSAAVRSKQIDNALEFLAFALDMRDKRKTLRALKRLSCYILMLPTDETRSVYSRPIVIDKAASAAEGGQRRTSTGTDRTLDNVLADLLQSTDAGLRDQATKMFNLDTVVLDA